MPQRFYARVPRARESLTSSGEIDSADVNALLELDIKPLRFAAPNLDDDAIASTVGRQTLDLELTLRVGERFADDGPRTL